MSVYDEEPPKVDTTYASTVDYSSRDYDDFLKDAERDDRVGEHDWMVTSAVHDRWPSGDPRIKIIGVLLTASGKEKPKADLTISPPPAPDVVRAEAKDWAQGKKRAIAQTITMYRKLAEYYQTSPDKIQEGDIFRVTTAKNKDGFIRVVAVHSREKIGASSQEAASVPF